MEQHATKTRWRRLAVAAVGVTAAVGLLAAPASAGPAAGKSTGGAGDEGRDVKLSLTAQGPMGAKGMINYRRPTTGAHVKGDVDCYTQVGNVGALSGRITNADFGTGPSGAYFLVEVQDNGEGASAAPDRFRVRFGDAPFACAPGGHYPGIASTGNLQVH